MIEVLDSHFAKKDILRKYTYAQYVDRFRRIGTFEIQAQLLEENLYLLDKSEQYYVLFYDKSKPIIGKIDDIKKESDEQYNKIIKLSGRLAPVLFTQRVINGTHKFSGKTYQRIESLVMSNLVQSSKIERNVPITVNFLNETIMKEKASKEDKQVTGGYVWDEMQNSLDIDNFGIDFYPILTMPTGETKTNVKSWVLDITCGNDRRIGNKEGNTPVIFSQQLSNIERTEYERKVENHKNVAYVAGEGEEDVRKWYEIDINNDVVQKVSIGWGRKELWIDARDIQSKNEDGEQLTDAEYEALIAQRANEKAAENTVQEVYEATKTESDKRYKYGVDYFKGDYVTVEDRSLNVVLSAQIVDVTHTFQGSKEIVDITFCYGQISKEPLKQIIENLNKTEQNKNDIKYIENKVSELEKVREEIGTVLKEQKTNMVWNGKPVYRINFDLSGRGELNLLDYIPDLERAWFDGTASFILGSGIYKFGTSFANTAASGSSVQIGNYSYMQIDERTWVVSLSAGTMLKSASCHCSVLYTKK